MKTDPENADLERTILHGLACEWHGALGVLDATHRRAMRPPLFGLLEAGRAWGTWSRDRRQISVARSLVLEHTWDSVREVLLHEMAHQLADEVLGAGDEAPHGPVFLRACHLLRANPAASGRCEPLDTRLSRGTESRPEDRLLARVKKLLALAGSPNRHEAEAAMAKAHALVRKYNLDLEARRGDRRYVSAFAGPIALRHPREAYALANLVQDFHFVQGIWVPAFALDRGRMGRVLEISGTRENVVLAAYVHDFVRRYIERSWQAYNRTRLLGRRRKTDFALGVLQGFRAKLEASRSRAEAQPAGGDGKQTEALVRRDPGLTRYLAYRHPRTTSFRKTLSGQDATVTREGERAGRKLVLHKGIHRRGPGGKLLGDG